MSDSDFSQAKALQAAVFEAALGFDDPNMRQAFLKHWFHDDITGLDEINGLLAASAESTAFFLDARESRLRIAHNVVQEVFSDERDPDQQQLVPELITVELIGSNVGPYRLVNRIGEGGGGVVYEAEQMTPLHRQVALKIVRLGMDTESVIARFEMERQALAMMDHRNIARVFDAGATNEGRPYFVMELVKGVRITAHCDEEKLSLRGRLELFLEVCHAIQHAHLKGIVHRDIKPSNILVHMFGGIAMPKVIDFGIAKATVGNPMRNTVLTGHDQLLGTPAHMSPEQIDMRGVDIDTRSDIYSLGVLLYELLAGQPPFDGEALALEGISQMRRILLNYEPPLPSQSLQNAGEKCEYIAAHRGMDAERLIAQLQGDLDAIVMKAMEKERNQRYQSVDRLEMDIKRFLANEPVEARQAGRLYYLRKFVHRNRGACISGIAVTVSLILGLGASTWLYLRERNAIVVQAQLLEEAKVLQQEKAILHKQAKDRAIVSRVAVLVSKGQVDKADAFLQSNPVESVAPSREATEVFRTLGHLKARKQQFSLALGYLRLLDQATRYEESSLIVESTDLLSIAPLILTEDGVAAYDAFRNQILLNHLPVISARGAEHVLKSCLLIPIDPAAHESLKDVASICESEVPSANGLKSHLDWNALSLALYYFRIGDQDTASKWCDHCFTFPSVNKNLLASARCIRALILLKKGVEKLAHEELNEVRVFLKSAENNARFGLSWWDVKITQILLIEAENFDKSNE